MLLCTVAGTDPSIGRVVLELHHKHTTIYSIHIHSGALEHTALSLYSIYIYYIYNIYIYNIIYSIYYIYIYNIYHYTNPGLHSQKDLGMSP